MDVARQIHTSGSYRVNAAHLLPAFQCDTQHVRQVAKRIRSFKQDDLEIIMRQRCPARDLQIAAIIANPAGEREPAAVRAPVNSRIELADALRRMPKSREPIRQLPRPRLESRIDVENDSRVETGAAHRQEMPSLFLTHAADPA